MSESENENTLKQHLINTLTLLIYNNIYCDEPKNPFRADKAAKGLENRLLGFRAELELKRALSKNNRRDILDGGFLLPVKRDRLPHIDSIYFTVSNDDYNRYEGIYYNLSQVKFLHMYFIKYSLEWNLWAFTDDIQSGKQLLLPHTECLIFNGGKFINQVISTRDELLKRYTLKRNPYKASFSLDSCAQGIEKAQNNLSQFDISELQGLVAERYIYDGILGMNVIKGKPTDIDLIINRNGFYSFLEVKEKDLSKKEPQGFGMDVHRMQSMRIIEDITGVPYYYVVKHVNNQHERAHMGWKYISIKKFEEAVEGRDVINGGMSMATLQSKNDTLVAPEHNFTDFPIVY